MVLKDKVIKHPDGYELAILAGKPIDNCKKFIYLMSRLGADTNYSLWNIEFKDEDNFRMSPYNGEDNGELIKELLVYYLENAYK